VEIDELFGATFNFIGKNPPSLLIMGGILLLIGGAGTATGIQTISYINWGSGILILGVLLHIMWLMRGKFRS
jgi:hypothetical protein